MSDVKESTETYRGNCHCGAFVYEIDHPEIKTVKECNCSICSRKGYLWLFPPTRDGFKIVKGAEDDLTTYKFAGENLHHKFCPTCGTGVMATMPGHPMFGLNAHTIQNLDTWTLQRTPVNGAALGSPYVVPAYTGRLPVEVEGGKFYTGNCHCGAVQVALATKPLDSTYPDMIGECNCSICERNAYVWVWPLRDQVILHGEPEDIGRYFFGSEVIGKTFCKRCGVQLTNEPSILSDEAVAALPEARRQVYDMVKPKHPVNVRVLEGIDLNELKQKIQQLPGSARSPVYVNP
ncbi:glutathione-dependent formaldehyde-activating enzyme [Ilyonectria robusta]|uniref:glutathione-dependent formaldehyde-activating enzyme n=1 Tax=Ilyonectria robusta TaxID=1079257 RepID=UPI001E8E7462|nr:glutathione-dependent formaldehyde-activating enzyme [Ilyonectria robusta]KAH8667809.1 glutathione-dependent formaldehyde-activating enzyme [Ilyonectria robusta]